MLIGITGATRVGKDTVANYLSDRYGFKATAFATPLKKSVQALYSLDDLQAFDDCLKDVRIPEWNKSPRELWCSTADALKAQHGWDFFINLWHMGTVGVEDVVVSDVRYEAEADRVRDLGGIIVHVKRPDAPILGGEVSKHSAHQGIQFKEGDALIVNDGSLDDLYDLIDEQMEIAA